MKPSKPSHSLAKPKKLNAVEIEAMFARARAQARAAGMKRSDIPKIIKLVRKKAKRQMKDEHFQELLASVHQMGEHLKGKKVPGVKITYRPKPTEKTTNVYADIGVKDPDGMLLKGHLAVEIGEIIRRMKLSQTQAAEIIGISQPTLAELLKGRFRDISESRMKDYLRRLEAGGQRTKLIPEYYAEFADTLKKIAKAERGEKVTGYTEYIRSAPVSKGNKKQAKKDYDEAFKAVQAILLKHWDPIGHPDLKIMPDEYDSYVSQVVFLAKTGASVADISGHLAHLEATQIGLPGKGAKHWSRCKKSGEAVVKYFRKHVRST